MVTFPCTVKLSTVPLIHKKNILTKENVDNCFDCLYQFVPSSRQKRSDADDLVWL